MVKGSLLNLYTPQPLTPNLGTRINAQHGIPVLHEQAEHHLQSADHRALHCVRRDRLPFRAPTR